MGAITALFGLCILVHACPAMAEIGSEHSSQLEQQAEQLRSLQEKVASLEILVESSSVLNRSRRRKAAFHAVMTKGAAQNTPIDFDTRFQIGTAYDPYTGYFTAPVSGLYLFTFQLFTINVNDIAFDLYINRAISIRSKCYHNSVSPTSCGASSFFRLRKGDKVWVQSNTAGVFFYPDEPTGSFFSGALISPA